MKLVNRTKEFKDVVGKENLFFCNIGCRLPKLSSFQHKEWLEADAERNFVSGFKQIGEKVDVISTTFKINMVKSLCKFFQTYRSCALIR